MEGFRNFPHTTTSQNPIPRESPSDQSLEAAFSRLNVSPFSHPPQFSGGDYSNGSVPKYPLHHHTTVGGNELLPVAFLAGDYEARDRIFGHMNMGVGDCWADSETDHGSGGFGSNLHKPFDIGPNWSQEPLNSLSVADLSGKIASLAKDQYGCRFFQRALEVEPKEFIDLIFSEVLQHVAHLMLDPYGNYVIQKLVEVCSEDQRTQILLLWTKNPFLFVTLCLHSRGYEYDDGNQLIASLLVNFGSTSVS